MTDQLRYFRSFHFTSGELARVRAMCRANGTSIILPYDQFIEHDCRHLEAKSDAGNPHYIMQLADEGGYNAVAVHYGVAMRAWTRLDGKVPLVVKLNGKTSIPSDAQALSTHTSWVEDAVRIGAVGVGYTLYYGSPRQDVDIEQLAARPPRVRALRHAAHRLGLPPGRGRQRQGRPGHQLHGRVRHPHGRGDGRHRGQGQRAQGRRRRLRRPQGPRLLQGRWRRS